MFNILVRDLIGSGSLLLKVLLLMFTINASFVFGACCAAVNSDLSEEQAPCHDSSDEGPSSFFETGGVDQSSDQHGGTPDTCCSACTMMQACTQTVKRVEKVTDVDFSIMPLMLTASNITPPFRPPILHLV
ncbi:hypothetical protein N9N07_03490 [Pseudomonadales bacterium]|nr:hypothetical protein [Pseudomonadales bacterium]